MMALALDELCQEMRACCQVVLLTLQIASVLLLQAHSFDRKDSYGPLYLNVSV